MGVVVAQNDTTTTAPANTTDTTAPPGTTTTTTTRAPVLLGTLEVSTSDTWNTTGNNIAPTVAILNAHADVDTSNDLPGNDKRKLYFEAKKDAMQAGITSGISVTTKTLAKEDMSFAASTGRRLASHEATLQFVTKAEIKSVAGLTDAVLASVKSAAKAAMSSANFTSSVKNAFEASMTSSAASLGITAGTAVVDITVATDSAGTSAAAPVVAGVSAALAMFATLF